MKVINNAPLPELLAPAGSPEALDAATEAGADAVYFGAELFSNRMRAKNFTHDELARAIDRCALAGVKSYITVNTRLHEAELDEAAALMRELYLAGASAFIVADAGLAVRVKRQLPDIVLHASTQMTGASSLDAAALSRLGFSRMVCPRELSREEIFSLVGSSPIETEMFVHGAHCVSVSGQCLMSWAMGGRSGNRGECAQPCRLPYKLGSCRDCFSHPLSLKDMTLASHVPGLIESGVCSLKLEGRLKGADYVYGTVRIWRQLLDERRAATADELRLLAELFSRDGFTDGYFTRRYRAMNGIRAEDAKSATVTRDAPARTRPIGAVLDFFRDRPARLTLSCDGVSVTVAGDSPTAAKSAPLDRTALHRSMARLGGSVFSLDIDDFSCETDGESFMPVSRLNALRRQALDALESALLERSHRCLPSPGSIEQGSADGGVLEYTATDVSDADRSVNEGGTADGSKAREYFAVPRRTASFLSLERVPDEAAEYFDMIFLPTDEALRAAASGRLPTERLGLSLPLWQTDASLSDTAGALARFAELGGRCTLAHFPSQLTLSREAQLTPVASERFNITNSAAADAVRALGAQYVILSPELRAGALRQLSRRARVPCGAAVYGKLTLMLLRRCIMSDRKCSGVCGGDGCLLPSALSDRRGTSLPVLPSGERTNIILNPHVLWCADTSLPDGLASSHFIFTDESAESSRAVIDAYRRALPPEAAHIPCFKRL